MPWSRPDALALQAQLQDKMIQLSTMRDNLGNLLNMINAFTAETPSDTFGDPFSKEVLDAQFEKILAKSKEVLG